MYYNDHNPPHFHARYGDEKATIVIETLSILDGRLSSRVRGLVVEWAAQHSKELKENWNLAREMKPLNPIPPLQ